MSLEGQQLGEFEILEQLGQGGMGAVYKARQTSLERFVALKALQAGLADDAEYIARFKQEAKAAAVLNHPNLVQVFSAGENEGLHWFAMEYVEGESARDRLKRMRRLEPLEAIAIAVHVATALEYGWRKAHLIHRDIKPDNIFLSSDGEVKLGDLGLAKSTDQAQGLTTTGHSMGTPHYISPEQVESTKDVDLRADIYSLGCTLFHLLSGKAPFEGNSAVAIMMKHVHEPVPALRAAWPDCPEGLDNAVRKMMQKEPEARQQNYADVIMDLQQAYHLLSGQTMAPVNTRREQQRAVWVGSAAAAFIAIGALLYATHWKREGAVSAENVRKLPSVQKRSQSIADTTKANTQSTAAAVAVAATPLPVPSTPALSPPVSPASLPSTPVPSATPKPPTEIEKWLTGVDGPQEDAFQKQVLKPFEAGVADLRARYLAALESAITKASANGHLDDALAWRAERLAFEKAQNVPADAADTWAAVKVLRREFRQRLAKLEQDRIAQAKALFAKYDAVLAKNETLLTQRQRLDDALLLKNKREEIALAWLGSPAVVGIGGSEAAKPSAMITLPASSSESPFVNTLGMKFVPVPGTKVLFSVWDTRVQDYAAYAKANNVDDSWTRQEENGVPVSREALYPVVGVSWDDAQGFNRWLTEKELTQGKLPKGSYYRLPSDEEWSWAVGLPVEAGTTPAEKSGRSTLDFPWGKNYPPAKKEGNYADESFRVKFPDLNAPGRKAPYGWMKGYDDGYATTSPVGTFPANRYGLYDMGGNVWQWCEDWFDATHKKRVVRGASWTNYALSYLLSTYRGHYASDYRFNVEGFRSVLVLADKGPASVLAPTVATKETPFVNSLGMKFVPVPGTKLLFCAHETRKRDYASYSAVTPGLRPYWKGSSKEGYPISDGDDYPVTTMTWSEAKGFCAWLSKKENLTYRLPTDREWSFAVGIGNLEKQGAEPRILNRGLPGIFPWGRQWPPPPHSGNFGEVSYHKAFPKEDWLDAYTDGYPTTAPVMSFDPNSLGIYDLEGNVIEWCEDLFQSNHEERVLRGGGWGSGDAKNLLSSMRSAYLPEGNQYPAIRGFRCVLELSANP